MTEIHTGIMMQDHDAGSYPPFCSPLRLRCFPCAQAALWTRAYRRSGKWSRQSWGGFCAHSVQNSCIHIKWTNCPDIKWRLINALPLVFYILLNWSISITLLYSSPHCNDEGESPSFTPAESSILLKCPPRGSLGNGITKKQMQTCLRRRCPAQSLKKQLQRILIKATSGQSRTSQQRRAS